MTTQRTITVLQVLPQLISGGVERGTLEIAIAQKQAGMRPLVASAGGKLVEVLKQHAIEHITLPLGSKHPLQMRANAKRLARLVTERNIDLIHARSRAPAWSAYLAAKRSKCRFVTTFHGTYGHQHFIKRRYNNIMTKGQIVIAISKHIQSHIKNIYYIDLSKVRLIHRGVDLSQFSPDAMSSHRLEALNPYFGKEQTLPVLFLPARFTRWKGQFLFLEALRQLDLPYYAVLAGKFSGHEDYVRELKRYIRTYLDERYIRLIDSLSDMPAAFARSDIVVAPSQEPEAFGRIPIEAAAMGRLCVASDLGGFRESILNRETGFLFAHDDPGSLAETLRQLLQLDASRKEAIAQAARTHVETYFSLETMCTKTLDVYREVMELEPLS